MDSANNNGIPLNASQKTRFYKHAFCNSAVVVSAEAAVDVLVLGLLSCFVERVV
jgi:hypothetical protein